MNSSEKIILAVCVILCACNLTAMAISPKLVSLETFVLSILAALLAGLHSEFKRLNDRRDLDNDKNQS